MTFIDRKIAVRYFDTKHVLQSCPWASQFSFKGAKNQIWVGGNAGVKIIFLKPQMFFGYNKYPKKLIFLELSKILPSASSQHN